MVCLSTDHDFGSWTGMAKTWQLDKDSIPRYLIVSKDGKLINMDASRPSELKTYDLLVSLAGK